MLKNMENIGKHVCHVCPVEETHEHSKPGIIGCPAGRRAIAPFSWQRFDPCDQACKWIHWMKLIWKVKLIGNLTVALTPKKMTKSKRKIISTNSFEAC